MGTGLGALIGASAWGGLLIILAVALRGLLRRRMPGMLPGVLWALCVARLLFWGKLPLPVTSAAVEEHTPAGDAYTAILSLQGGAPAAGGLSSVAAGVWETLRAALPWVWLAGAAGLGAALLARYVLALARLREAVPLWDDTADWLVRDSGIRRRIRLRELDTINSPLTYGILRPVIVFPKGIDWDEPQAAWMLRHELAHVRRFDALVKLLCACAVCLHWFNPFVWLLWRMLDGDAELACDALATHKLTDDQRADYASLLVRVERGRAACASGFFGRNALKARVRALLEPHGRGVVTGTVLPLLVVLLAFTASAAAPRTIILKGVDPVAVQHPVDGSIRLYTRNIAALRDGAATAHVIELEHAQMYHNGALNKGWELEKGQSVQLAFGVPKETEEGRHCRIGWIKREPGFIEAECDDYPQWHILFDDELRPARRLGHPPEETFPRTYRVKFEAPEDGEYVFFLMNRSIDPILIDSVEITPTVKHPQGELRDGFLYFEF